MLQRFFPSYLLLTVYFLISTMPAHAQEQITFTFQPPDVGITLILTEKKTETKTTTTNGASENEVIVSNEKTRVDIAKTATGYTWTTIKLSKQQTYNGIEMALSSLDRAMMSLPATIELDKTGHFVGIRGIEAIHDKALEGVEGDERMLFEKFMTKGTMEKLARSEWEANAGALLGITKKPGDSWQTKVKWLVLSQDLPQVTASYTFEKMDDVAGHPCAVLKRVIKPDLKLATQDLRKLFDELQAIPAELKPAYAALAFTEEHRLSIDPTLLFPWQKMDTCTKKYKITVQGTETVITEKTEATVTVAIADMPAPGGK
jgi:hypothetical protein